METKKESLDKFEINFKINKKEFHNKNALYYEIEFESLDGSLIYAKYIRPAKKNKFSLVLEFHDYKQASRGWHHLTRYAGIGYGVLAMDCRGQGGKSSDLNKAKGPTVSGHIIKGIDDEIDNMYYINTYCDAYLLSKIAQNLDDVDSQKLITFGKGQGGALALVVASLNKNIKKCSMQYPFLADFKRVWDMDLDKEAYDGIRYYFKWFDSMHIRELEFFKKLSYIDVVNFARNLNCEVLMGTGLLDEVCPPSTQYAIFNNIKCKKTHLIFHKYGHEINNFFENENLKFMRF